LLNVFFEDLFIYKMNFQTYILERPSWLWLYGKWIYNYLCNQCLSPPRRSVLDTTLCDKVCQWSNLWPSRYK